MQQDTALEILKTGANAFLTGEPGSGKTHTINRYVSWLRDRGIEPAVTASTGIAATHIGGHTIHSWSGLGARTEISMYDLEALHEKEHVWRRVNGAEVLIIEEVSMLEARAIDSVDAILRTLRHTEAPFGGVQVIFVGDFFQLPPVKADDYVAFAFRSHAWRSAKPVTLYLTEQYRQEDPQFLEILSAMRHQSVTTDNTQALSARNITTEADTVDTATKLYAHNADVDAENQRQLQTLTGTAQTYTMETQGPKALVDQLKRGCLSPETLELREGAVVMCTKNNPEEGYVNGTLGTVVGFAEDDMPRIRTREGRYLKVTTAEWSIMEDGKPRARIRQVPLRLAWAITVHKSQGMSLDAAIIDLSSAFEYGQGYVALSRVRSLDGLYLRGFNDRALEVHPEVAQQDDWFRRHAQAVAEKFNQLPQEEVARRQREFVEQIGGSWETVARKGSQPKQSTYELTRQLLVDGKGLAEIAEERQKTTSTILGHLEKLIGDGEVSPDQCMHLWEETGRSSDELDGVLELFGEHGTRRLRPVYDALHGEYTFEELRLARLMTE